MNDGLLLGLGTDGQPLRLDPKALTTHAFCLGMTGSGKTGLCVVMIEELLEEGIPVIAVDSKGDLGTLLLNFDATDTASLAAWSPDATAAAAGIQKALAGAGLTAEQWAMVRSKYEPRLYTPGSNLGIPVDVLGSLAPPDANDVELVAETADSIARALLGLVGIEADPVSSREYLLLVQILTTAWSQNQTPSLVDLIRQVNQPPFQQLGALSLEDFFPQRERAALMIRLNGLVASPKFAAWRNGDPLDPAVLFRAPDGRPRLSVYSVAHLSDEERIVAVAQLLQRLTGWMKKQGGASTTRALVLVDEIFGYFPPNGNPPTKPPLLTLLKQARAFGVSIVLATQNPVDLDYRGLANIGTWLVGRLQTEQDKARIRDALTAAAASTGASATQLDALISTLQQRHFLLHSVHRPAPTVFKSRDAMTLLHGPFSADELKRLTAPMKAANASVVATGAPAVTPAAPTTATGATATPSGAPAIAAPVGLEPELGPLYEVDQGQAQAVMLLKFGVRYRMGSVVSEETMHELAFPIENTLGPGECLEGAPYSVKGMAFQQTPPAGMTLTTLPNWALTTKFAKISSALKDRLPSKLETKLMFDAETKLVSGPTESLEAFTARVIAKQGISKSAQAVMQKLEKKKADLAQAEREVSSRKAEKWASVGTGLLSVFAGRSRSFGGVGRALSSQTRQTGAEGKVEDLQIEVQQLEAQLTGMKEIDATRFSEQVCVPKAADVQVLRMCLAFLVP